MASVTRRSYRLLPGSELLRPVFWWRAEQSQLKILIKRFATREDSTRRKGLPTYVWRNRRLRAVAVYEARFEAVPELLRSRRLLPLNSYYVRNGKYIWPERGEPGRPVLGHRRLTPRWSGRVRDKVPSSCTGVRAAQLNR